MNELERSVPEKELLTQYGCGPIRFSGRNDALYERHLLFDDICAPEAAGSRERFEAAARSVRDVLSQRWILTDSTYDRENPKRIYYVSMEFLASPLQRKWPPAPSSTRSASSNKNPMPGWETAGSVGSRPAFSIRWRRCSFRPWATGCVTNTAYSNSVSRTAGSANSRTTGCAARTPGRSPAQTRPSKSH